LIRRLIVGALAVPTLLACATAADPAETPVEREGTVLTQPERADSRAAEDKTVPESAEEPAARPSEGPTSDCLAGEGRLVVTGAGGEVTVIDPDGANRIQLRGPVRPGHPGLQPTWSSVCRDGGRQVAWTEAEEDGTFVIALADTTTAQIRRHPSPVAPFYYYWSPDANLLAFLGQNAFSPIQMGILTLQTGEVETVGEGQPFYFDWHYDSDAMVAHIGDTLSLLARHGGDWSSQETSLNPGLFQAPAWVSPDHIMIVAAAAPGTVEVDWKSGSAQGDLPAQSLIISDLDGASIRTLADLEGAAVFSPDPTGARVAFTDFGGPLQVLDLDQGVAVGLTERRVAAFQWSPDGSRLLFMEVDPAARALVPKVWNGTETQLFASFIPTQAFVLQYLPFWDQYSRSLTLWAPDSRAFTYPAASADRSRIMVQHLNDRLPTEVAEGVFASWSPSSG